MSYLAVLIELKTLYSDSLVCVQIGFTVIVCVSFMA